MENIYIYIHVGLDLGVLGSTGKALESRAGVVPNGSRICN